jgi:hypothetical protein
MTFPDWREPVRRLTEQTGPATRDQLRLAKQLSLTFDASTPRAVASTLLEDALRPAIWGSNPEPATDKQRAYLLQLERGDVSGDADLSKAAASAWLDHLLSLRTIQSLGELQLVQGVGVLQRTTWTNPESGETFEHLDEHTISSIGGNGLVYFKGGNGKCAWPASLSRAL